MQYVDKANDGALLTAQTLNSGEISDYNISNAGPKFAVGGDASGVDETFLVYTKVSNTEFQVRLHRSLRCGCSPKVRQFRLIVMWLRPTFWAISRVLQCVAPLGVDSSVFVITRSICSSSISRGRPATGRDR